MESRQLGFTISSSLVNNATNNIEKFLMSSLVARFSRWPCSSSPVCRSNESNLKRKTTGRSLHWWFGELAATSGKARCQVSLRARATCSLARLLNNLLFSPQLSPLLLLLLPTRWPPGSQRRQTTTSMWFTFGYRLAVYFHFVAVFLCRVVALQRKILPFRCR